MTEVELFTIIEHVSEQYETIFAQVITINFAMIVAIWYFLHRARLAFRVAAFGFYLIGMLALIGMLLLQSNVKLQAITALRAMPAATRSPFISAYLEVQESWLAVTAGVFFNASLWVLIAAVAWLLFAWRGDRRNDALA